MTSAGFCNTSLLLINKNINEIFILYHGNYSMLCCYGKIINIGVTINTYCSYNSTSSHLVSLIYQQFVNDYTFSFTKHLIILFIHLQLHFLQIIATITHLFYHSLINTILKKSTLKLKNV